MPPVKRSADVVSAGIRRCRFDRVGQLGEGVPNKRRDEIVQIGEIVIERRGGHAHFARDGPYRQARSAFFGHQLARGVFDLFARDVAK